MRKRFRKITAILLTVVLILVVIPFGTVSSSAAETTNEPVGATQKAMFIMDTVNISQGMYEGTHQGSKAIDFAGRDGGIDPAYAPFDGKVVYISISAAYIVYQSLNPVEFADGTVDYMTVWVIHDDDVGRFYVGQTFLQGQHFFNEGSSGYATGNHIHLECARGTYQGQYQNDYGWWCINNQINPYDALYLSESTTIINGYGYNWRRANGSMGDSDTHYGAEGINFDGINVSNVSFFDAKIGGWMRNPNSYNIRSYGFYFGNNQNALLQYTIGQNVRWTDAYINANLSDYVGRLSQGVQYYYRFFSLTDGYNLSPVYSFTTVGNSTVTFENITSNNIDNDNMSIECWARNHQGLKILKYGVYYGTAINELNECIEVGNNVYWTDFYVNVKMIEQNVELKPNTTYYYQFFALTDGWNFSSVNSFTTGDYVPLKYSELDVNFLVDGKIQVNIDGIGEIQVYVNGQLQGYGTDFCKNVPAGKPYEIKINITNPDYYFCGVDILDSGYSGLTGISEYNGTKVNLVICKDSGGITDIPSGNYAIVSAIDTKYGLDIAGDNLPANNNDNVILYPIGDAFRPQDIFTITNLGNGYYSINQLNTDMSIDVYGGNTTRFGNISMYQSNNSIAQQWKISYDSLASGYTFQAKCSGMYMTVESGSAEAGKNIYQNIKNDSIPKSQGWVLIPYISADSTILGDANLDGIVSIGDVTAIQRHLAELTVFNEEQLALADTNGDGEINIADATHLQMYLAEYDVVLGKT